MSVQTAADEHLEKAHEHLQSAIESLSQIVVDKCYGWDDYCYEFKSTLFTSFKNLIEIRDNLNGNYR